MPCLLSVSNYKTGSGVPKHYTKRGHPALTSEGSRWGGYPAKGHRARGHQGLGTEAPFHRKGAIMNRPGVEKGRYTTACKVKYDQIGAPIGHLPIYHRVLLQPKLRQHTASAALRSVCVSPPPSPGNHALSWTIRIAISMYVCMGQGRPYP